MDNIGVLEASDDMYDGVAFADICKELISESFTLGRALDQSCDIDEFEWLKSARSLSLSSGTGTIPILGSIVQNG